MKYDEDFEEKAEEIIPWEPDPSCISGASAQGLRIKRQEIFNALKEAYEAGKREKATGETVSCNYCKQEILPVPDLHKLIDAGKQIKALEEEISTLKANIENLKEDKSNAYQAGRKIGVIETEREQKDIIKALQSQLLQAEDENSMAYMNGVIDALYNPQYKNMLDVVEKARTHQCELKKDDLRRAVEVFDRLDGGGE